MDMRKTGKIEYFGIFLMVAGVVFGFGGIASVGGLNNYRCLPVALLAGLILGLGIFFYVLGILLAPSTPKPDA
jgi:hypothetical protein